jgi:hypothetical protein
MGKIVGNGSIRKGVVPGWASSTGKDRPGNQPPPDNGKGDGKGK